MAVCLVPALALSRTLISFLVFGSAYTLLRAGIFSIVGTGEDVLSNMTLRWVLLLAPGMLLGIQLGRKAFARADPAGFRLRVLNLLILISALSVARALTDWYSMTGGWSQ